MASEKRIINRPTNEPTKITPPSEIKQFRDPRAFAATQTDAANPSDIKIKGKIGASARDKAYERIEGSITQANESQISNAD